MSVTPDYPLAVVMRIVGIRPIPGADNIQVYQVSGWDVIDKIGAYEKDGLVVYCMINTIFPESLAMTSFLKGERLKTKKMRGVISQGLFLPISVVPHSVQEGDDLTTELGLRKWVPSSELDLYQTDNPRSTFPDYIPKTDEERIQNIIKSLSDLVDRPVTITIKRDGTSATYDKDKIAGRNYVHTAPTGSSKHYFEMEEKYDIKKKLQALQLNIAIQGEITGSKINGNRHGLKENQFHVFNIYSIDSGQYLTWDQVVSICKELGIPTVQEIFRGVIKKEDLTLDYFLQLADSQVYENKLAAEGIVIKTDTLPRVSFKAISNKYLLKHNL